MALYGTGSTGTAYGPNLVLGLELIGQEVLYNSTSGEISWGATTTYSNAGYCGSSVLTAGSAQSSGSPTVSSGTYSGYYPPSDSDSANAQTFTQYDVLQVGSTLQYREAAWLDLDLAVNHLDRV